MSRFLVVLASLLFAAPALATSTVISEDSRRLSYGDALYYAYQGEWFEAIARLDAQQAQIRGLESKFDAPFSHSDRLAGDFELNYRMQQRAERAMKAVIEGPVQDPVRNEALFRLARMYFQKGQAEEASRTAARIRGAVPAAIRSDLAFLRANIALAVGRNGEAVAILNDLQTAIRSDLAFLRANIALAVGRNAEDGSILKDLQSEKGLEGFSSYNLAIALLKTGNEQPGRECLDRTGRIESDDRATLAIKDKANLILGEKLLGDNHFEAAKEVLDRVRLSGPFSNRALLSSGWADALQERYKNALVPWSILAGREVTDPAVQEALLAVPYAYNKLGLYGTAALKYETALKAFGKEIVRLDASIVSIRQGAFLKSLLRAELSQDADWIVNLRELPEAPETFYLLDLMASNDFQESLKNYLDLEELRKKLETWPGDMVAFEDIIRLRRAHYQTLLPAIDREFKRLESQMRLRTEQRDRIAQQLEAMLSVPRPDLLVTADERLMSERVARLEKLVTPRSEEIAPRLCNRIRRLRGVLVWNMYAEYDKRYDDSRTHLRELDQELDALSRQQRAFARARQTAIEGYQGYVDGMRRLRLGIEAAREKVRALIARQGQVIEIMAVNELTTRRDRLEEFRVKARFALADSYDRAGKTTIQKRDAH